MKALAMGCAVEDDMANFGYESKFAVGVRGAYRRTLVSAGSLRRSARFGVVEVVRTVDRELSGRVKGEAQGEIGSVGLHCRRRKL